MTDEPSPRDPADRDEPDATRASAGRHMDADAREPQPGARRMLGPFGRGTLFAAGVFVLMAAAAALVWFVVLPALSPRASDEEVSEALVARIQREAPEAFLVTGRLDVVGTATVENTRTLLPELLDFSLGTTRSTVRAPGRVSYGFDVRWLEPDMIHVRGDSVIHIELPRLSMHSVEPVLSEMEVQTDVGWARTGTGSGREVERHAIAIIQRALREQAEAHLRSSMQPRVNTAEALRDMLAPVLVSLGMEDTRLHFDLTPSVEMEARGDGR